VSAGAAWGRFPERSSCHSGYDLQLPQCAAMTDRGHRLRSGLRRSRSSRAPPAATALHPSASSHAPQPPQTRSSLSSPRAGGRLYRSWMRERAKAGAGFIYVAPPDRHLTVEKDRTCASSADRARTAHVPPSIRSSASAAAVYKEGAIGVVLTATSTTHGRHGVHPPHAGGRLCRTQTTLLSVDAAQASCSTCPWTSASPRRSRPGVATLPRREGDGRRAVGRAGLLAGAERRRNEG